MSDVRPSVVSWMLDRDYGHRWACSLNTCDRGRRVGVPIGAHRELRARVTRCCACASAFGCVVRLRLRTRANGREPLDCCGGDGPSQGPSTRDVPWEGSATVGATLARTWVKVEGIPSPTTCRFVGYWIASSPSTGRSGALSEGSSVCVGFVSGVPGHRMMRSLETVCSRPSRRIRTVCE